jgi:hypothetical protein
MNTEMHSLGVRGVGSSNLPVPTNFTAGPSQITLGISPAGSRFAHACKSSQLGLRGRQSKSPVPDQFFLLL